MSQLKFASGSWVLLVAGVLAISGIPARAAADECSNRTLVAQDQRHLMAAVKAVKPADMEFEGKPVICRNPGTASAQFVTARVQKADGLEEWWTLWCERGTVTWSCDSPVLERRALLTRSIEGQQRRVHIAFGAQTPLATAQELAIRALNIFEERRALTKQCKRASADKDKDPQEIWNDMRMRYLLQPSDVDLNVVVVAGADATRVRFFDQRGLEFSFVHGGSECWSEWTERKA
jgi:hypothetical protein